MTVRALLLSHGAGSDRDHATLVAIEERLAPLPVVRVNFPYRDMPGRRPPDRMPVLIASLRSHLREVCDSVGCDPDEVVVGGRSMGGRVASMMVAEGTPVAGWIAIGYPLHPPGRPERLRTEHLPLVGVPTLLISGDRDPFGTPDELAAAAALVAGAVTMRTIPGGRHELKGADTVVADEIAGWLGSLATP